MICDTDAFATAIWKRRYLGDASGGPWTDVPPRAVYLLTDHDGVPWHDNGMREGDLAIRAEMTGYIATTSVAFFLDELTKAESKLIKPLNQLVKLTANSRHHMVGAQGKKFLAGLGAEHRPAQGARLRQ